MPAPAFEKKLLAPRFWPAWIAAAILWLLARLPWAIQLRTGAAIGWLAYRLLGRRINDTRTNIRLCFPEKSDAEREAMVRDIFRNAGITLFETANAWFRSIDYYRTRTHFEGLQYLQQAQEQGRAVLLLGAHYSMLDLGGNLVALHFPVSTVYRPQKNAVINYVMTRGRTHSGQGVIANTDMRGLLRAFKKKSTVWYTSDQDYGLRHAVFAPFFGQPAATLTTPARLARANHLTCVLIHFCRDGDTERYRVRFMPAPENFPSAEENDIADATLLNAEIEKMVRTAPTQYMWYHRRFKTVPEGGTFPYQYKPKELQWQKEVAERKKRAQKNHE